MPSSELKKFCERLHHAPNILLKGMKDRAQKQLCSNTLKSNELKFYIRMKSNNLACFTNVHVYLYRKKEEKQGACFFLVVHAWNQKFQNSTHKNCASEFLTLSALKSPSCELVVFKDMSTCRRQEFQNILERKLCSSFGQLLDVY